MFATDVGIVSQPASVLNLLYILEDFGTRLKSIDARAISWEDFPLYQPPLDLLIPQLRNPTLFIHGERGVPKDEYVTVLGKGLTKASSLQKLELAFNCDEPEHLHKTIFLEDLWPDATPVYSYLKTFHLSGVRTPQWLSEEFLFAHASTLQHLVLHCIDFEWTETRDDLAVGSWTDTIHFLQEEPCLKTVNLCGTLSNRWCECWVSSVPELRRSLVDAFTTEHPTLDAGWLRAKPLHETLRYRIEQYIVQGGICPLDPPPGREEENPWDWWNEIRDYSWFADGSGFFPPDDEYDGDDGGS